LDTCICSPLFLAQRLEGHALEACDLALEEAQVHDRLAAVVLALDVRHLGALDLEDRHPAPVQATDLDAAQLATTQKPEGSQEQVFGLKHRRLLVSLRPWTAGGELRWVRSQVSPSLL
jgi:hypothetical protein